MCVGCKQPSRYYCCVCSVCFSFVLSFRPCFLFWRSRACLAVRFLPLPEPRPVPGGAAAVGHGRVLRGRVRKDGRLHGAGQRRGEHQARGGVCVFVCVCGFWPVFLMCVFFLSAAWSTRHLFGEETRETRAVSGGKKNIFKTGPVSKQCCLSASLFVASPRGFGLRFFFSFFLVLSLLTPRSFPVAVRNQSQ